MRSFVTLCVLCTQATAPHTRPNSLFPLRHLEREQVEHVTLLIKNTGTCFTCTVSQNHPHVIAGIIIITVMRCSSTNAPMRAEVHAFGFVSCHGFLHGARPGEPAGTEHAASLADRPRNFHVLLDKENGHAAFADAVDGPDQR